MEPNTLLTPSQVAKFGTDGFLVLPNFYDPNGDVAAVQRGVFDIIGLVAEDHGVALDRPPFGPTTFDSGYLALKSADRKLASIVYDAVKQLAPFARLVADPRNEAVFRELRDADVVGVAGGGSGIRIDNPDEDQFRAWWHQEYPAQFRSADGVVFWSPLRAVTQELGPVEILIGSHREGLLPVKDENIHEGRSGAYALRLAQEAELVARYESAAPLVEPGDLVLIDFLTIHRSGENRAETPRWTMQLRYFNFSEPIGRAIGWAGSFSAGNRISDIHPELTIVP